MLQANRGYVGLLLQKKGCIFKLYTLNPKVYLYIYIYIHIHIYVYTYTYRHVDTYVGSSQLRGSRWLRESFGVGSSCAQGFRIEGLRVLGS